ncbi:hypothetical protein ABZX98_34625 [Streptomyces sp. NPDC002992]|uniref:hypothetical protein n=1 Tax=Streptomyces sp. NPDC002992 TaxID=3154273 RepID=UPI0033B0F4C7
MIQPPPLLKSALEHPPTVVGLRRAVRRRLAWLTGSVVLPVALTCMWFASGAPERFVGALVVYVLVTPLLIGLNWMGLAALRRAKRVLRMYPWRVYACSYGPADRNQSHLIILDVGCGSTLTLCPVPFRQDLQSKRNWHPHTLWFAGDPLGGGVASPVGGHYPVRVVRQLPPGDFGSEDPSAPPLAERAGLARDGRYRRLLFRRLSVAHPR